MGATVARRPLAMQPVASRGRFYSLAILAVALLLRLGVVGIVLSQYPRNWLFSKAPDLAFLAHSINAGRGLDSPFGGSTGPTAFLAPGYPALLGLIFHLFGSYSRASAAALMILQIVFALLTVAVIMHVGQRLFGPAPGLLAGAFWAISPPLLWLPVIPWETGLSTLLMMGMVALALSRTSRPGNARWALLGAYCGMAMLVNLALMLALLSLLLWTVYQTRSQRRFGPGLSLLVCLAIFAPWPIRNALVLHAFIPLRSNFGYELWQGNHPGASGFFNQSIEPLANQREYADYARLGEIAYMRGKTVLAQAYIRAHPEEFLKLCGKRMVRFWVGAGAASNNSGLVESHIVLTSLSGLLGLAALCRQRASTALLFLLPIFLFPLPYYITHPDFRFRIVLDPLLTLLGAYAVTLLAGHRNAGLVEPRIRLLEQADLRTSGRSSGQAHLDGARSGER